MLEANVASGIREEEQSVKNPAEPCPFRPARWKQACCVTAVHNCTRINQAGRILFPVKQAQIFFPAPLAAGLSRQFSCELENQRSARLSPTTLAETAQFVLLQRFPFFVTVCPARWRLLRRPVPFKESFHGQALVYPY